MLLLGLSFIFIVGQVWLDLKIPDYMAEVTKLVQTEGHEISEILEQGIMMLFCAFGSLICAFVTGYCASYVGSAFGRNIRSQIFHKVEDFNMAEIKKFSIPSLITRCTNDIRHIQMFAIMGIQIAVKAPIMAIVAITKIWSKGFEFTMVTAVGVAVILAMIITLIIIVLPKFKIIQTLTDNLNRITREGITGTRVVRAYNAEAYQEKRFSVANQELTDTNLFTGRAMAIIGPVISTVMSGLSLTIYWLGTALINSATASDKIDIFSNMVVFSSYAVQVIMAFMLMTVVLIVYPRASVSAKRINEVLDTEITITDGDIDHDVNNLHGVVEFKNVSFKYPDAEDYIIENVSFKTSPGETIAFIGSTGSGKSTIINLIPRFYDVTDGEILIDDVNVKDMTLEYLHNKIGYISQTAFMFKGTVSKNISLGHKDGKKPTRKQIKRAIKLAQATDFVEKMKGDYKAKIAQSGTNISGGQKQRLSIARAIARDPEIFIFDDSFSALDYKTDKTLRQALNKATKNATKFIVAQRIGTIMDADQIIVLDQGKCVGIGKHHNLLKNCPIYKEIALSQLSSTELEEK